VHPRRFDVAHHLHGESEAIHGGSGHVPYYQGVGGGVSAKSIHVNVDRGPTLLVNPGTYTLQVYGLGDDTATYSFVMDVYPTSQVTPLPANSNELDFVVSWSGDDQTDGSGIANYDVFVSANDGDYELWLARTPCTLGVYPGAESITYSFYSLAYDNVCNIESKAALAEATTTTPDADGNPLDWQCGPWGIKVTPYGTDGSEYIKMNWPGGGELGNALQVYYAIPGADTPQLWAFLTDGVWRQVARGRPFATSYRLFHYYSSDDQAQDNPVGVQFDTVEVTACNELNIVMSYTNNACSGDSFTIDAEVLLDAPDVNQTSMTTSLTVTNVTGIDVVPHVANGQTHRALSEQWKIFGISSMYVVDDFSCGIPAWYDLLDGGGEYIGTIDIDDGDLLNDGFSVLNQTDVSTHDTKHVRIDNDLVTLDHDENLLPNADISCIPDHDMIISKQAGTRISLHHLHDPARDHRVRLLQAEGLTTDLDQLKWSASYDRDDANLFDGDNIEIMLGLDDMVDTWPAGEAQTLELWLATGTPPAALTVEQGWNLISMPVEVDQSAAELLVDVMTCDKVYDFIWGWSENRQLFYPLNTEQPLSAMTGYWLYSQGPQWDSPPIIGHLASGLVELVEGWNLVGVISETAPPVDPAVSGAIWWWDAVLRKYHTVGVGENLIPGRGYWMFASEDMTVELGR